MATATQLVPMAKQVETVRTLLERLKPQLALALPKHMTPDRVMRVALTSILRTPELLECSQASLAGAILQASQLGLECDGVAGQAALVPFKKQVVLIPMYKGLMALARRSGEISTIEVRAVHAKDKFKVTLGLKPILTHEPHAGEGPGEFIAAYAISRFKDGGIQFEVMWKHEIDAIWKRSRAGADGPWVTDYEPMAKKTVLRQLCKLLPSSPDLQRAVSLDERAEIGIEQDLSALVEETASVLVEGTAVAGKLDQLTDKLEEGKAGKKPEGEQEKKKEPDQPETKLNPLDEALAKIKTFVTVNSLLNFWKANADAISTWTGSEQSAFKMAFDSRMTEIKENAKSGKML